MSQLTPTAPVKGRQYTNLEILRFLCALTVVIWHFQHFQWIGNAGHDYLPSSEPWSQVLQPIYTYGHYGVQFFWLLSGFIFFSQYLNSLAERRINGRTFTSLRFSRLYPLHIVTAVLVFCLQPIYASLVAVHEPFVYTASPMDLLLHTFMVNEWDVNRAFSLNGPVWSVSLEVLAYITFFVYARYLYRRNGWRPIVSLVTAVVAPGILILNLYGQLNPMVECLSMFYVGGLLFRLSEWLRTRSDRTRHYTLTLLGALAVVLFGSIVWASRADVIDMTMGQTLSLYAAFSLVIVVAATARQVEGRTGHVFRNLGNLTYSSYLVHFPVQLLTVIAIMAWHVTIPMDSPALLAFYVAVVFSVAWCVYRWFEMPAQTWLRKILQARR
jgi:peptidoglycan/LPS O-acetylase OafA/YrhL